MKKLKVAVLISGRGSNLQALIDACRDPDYPVEIVLVISNRADAKGIDRAIEAGIPWAIVDSLRYSSNILFEEILNQELVIRGVELVVLAGFMKVLSRYFVEKWDQRMINIHPSLLPKYKGLNPYEQTLRNGDTISGVTVHWVTPKVDSGPIIGQLPVPVCAGDTVTTLADRILKAEHQLLPMVVQHIAHKILSNSKI